MSGIAPHHMGEIRDAVARFTRTEKVIRTLELRAGTGAEHGELTYRLDGAEPGSWTRDLPLVGTTAGRSADIDPARDVVRDLVDGPAGSAVTDASVQQLGRLAVGFVLVRGPMRAEVVARLDATAGLARRLARADIAKTHGIWQSRQ